MTTAHQLARKLLESPNYELVVKEAGASHGTRVIDVDFAVNYTSPESLHFVPSIALVTSINVDRVPVHKDMKAHLRATPEVAARASYKSFPVGTTVFVRDLDEDWDNTEMGCLEPFGARGVVAKSTDDSKLGNGQRVFVRFTDKEVNEYKTPLTKSVVVALKTSTIAARLPR